jgi:hypothetical protein
MNVRPLRTYRVAFILALAISCLFLTAVAQDEVIPVAPGESVPITQQLGSGGSSLSVQAPTFGEWSLHPGQDLNEISGTMVVTTLGQGDPWYVTIPAGTENGGVLAEYDTTKGTYVVGGKKLDSSLQIVAEKGNSVDLATGGLLISGQGPTSIPIKLKQTVSYENSPLGDRLIYRTSITFTISSGLP